MTDNNAKLQAAAGADILREIQKLQNAQKRYPTDWPIHSDIGALLAPLFAEMDRRTAALQDEYEAWGAANGYDDVAANLYSADEMLLMYPELTVEQRTWLRAFIERWNHATGGC